MFLHGRADTYCTRVNTIRIMLYLYVCIDDLYLAAGSHCIHTILMSSNYKFSSNHLPNMNCHGTHRGNTDAHRATPIDCHHGAR